MDTPLIISGAGHTALILVLLFGGFLPRQPERSFDAAEVTVLSEEEFAALTRPEVSEEPAPPPMRPAEEPSAAVDEDAPEDQPPPEAPRVVDPAPEPAPEPEPEPAPPAAPELPRAEEDVPDAASRVAPDPAPPPPAPAETAPETRQAVRPDPAPEAQEPAEEAPAAAPEEAAPEIVTEAEEPSTRAAPEIVGRPRSRPDRPMPAAPEPEPDPEPAPRTEGETSTASSDALRDAVSDTIAGLEERLETGELQGAPAGPPLSQGEREAFRLQVRRCWNVDVGSEAADVTVTIRFAMNSDNSVVSGSLQQVSASGGSASAQRTAYEWGRRAILRCQVEGGGYDLPVEKYAQWQQVEVTFNPRDMRVR